MPVSFKALFFTDPLSFRSLHFKFCLINTFGIIDFLPNPLFSLAVHDPFHSLCQQDLELHMTTEVVVSNSVAIYDNDDNKVKMI